MKEQIKALEAALANGAEFALETFDRLLADDSLRRKDLLQLQSNFSHARIEFLAGRLAHDLFFKEAAKVAAALANLIPMLHSGDFKSITSVSSYLVPQKSERDAEKAEMYNLYSLHSERGQSLLQEAIAKINIVEKMSLLHTLNCNRDDQKKHFWQRFNQKKAQKSLEQYYFFSACPTQMPSSFCERMVYETLEEWFEEDQAIFFMENPRKEGRVLFHKLPIRNSLEESKLYFKRFCSKHFRFDDKVDFGDWVVKELPKKNYRYVILPFKIHKNEWTDFLPQYFDWIASQFANRGQSGPVIIFFFVIFHDNLHILPDKQSIGIMKEIDYFCSMRPAAASHEQSLSSVEINHLRNWFMDLGEDNPSRIDLVFDTLKSVLKLEVQELYNVQKKINMADVEIVQELVYKHAEKLNR